MAIQLLLLLAFGGLPVWALTSPFPSTVKGISIPNAHVVERDRWGDALVFRGMEPRTKKQYEELLAAHISRVIIFKDAESKKKKNRKSDVEREIEEWKKRGFRTQMEHPSRFYDHIEFQWKDFEDFKTPCQQTVRALRLLRDAVRDHAKIYFHCTVGEDRTGYLAGLFRLLSDRKVEAMDVFKNEMCRNGYSNGNPRKPDAVVGEIDNDLTPIFRKMAYKIESGKLRWNRLSDSVCEQDPIGEQGFKESEDYEESQYYCQPSELYDPQLDKD